MDVDDEMMTGGYIDEEGGTKKEIDEDWYMDEEMGAEDYLEG